MKNYTFLLLLFLISYSGSIQADPIKVQIEYSEPWGYYLPNKNHKTKQIELKGIWIEIIRLFSQYTKIELIPSLAPHARVLQNLANGKVDMSFQVRPEHDHESIIYVAEMFPIESIAVSMKNHPVKSYDDFMGKRIGLVRGTKISQQFDNDRLLFTQAFRNYEIIVTMLFQNRLDVIVGNKVSINYLMKKNKFAERYSCSFSLNKSSIWLQLSVFSLQTKKMKALKKSNEMFIKQGVYKKILERYIDYQL